MNASNQYTSRDVPGYATVLGSANSNATVTVNLQRAVRQGSYFWDELPVDNSSSALWLSLTNLAVLNNGIPPGGTDIVATNVGNIFVAQTPEAFGYDVDGNLTNDGRFAYTWDAENRLINLTSLSSAPTGSKVKLDYAYDCMGRRIQKIVSMWNTNTLNYQPSTTNRFVYDDWNLIAILNPQSSILASFTWGSDLSGSLQSAGGVGGLLVASFYGVQTTNCFPAFDGNGNVMAYINAADGTSVAQYEYDPFLNIIRANGPMAYVLPFLGSTKYYDWESGLYYYGYRYLKDGRWPNRDPIEEEGGVNVYSFVVNNPPNSTDFLGLKIKGCIDKYLNSLELKEKVDYRKDNGIYTALRDVQNTDVGNFAKVVAIRMMKSSFTFVLAGNGEDQYEENLKIHIVARATIIIYIKSLKVSWAEEAEDEVKVGRPASGESWSHWFWRMNKSETEVRCSQATKLVMTAGAEGMLTDAGRTWDTVYIPGDWVYIPNDAYNDPSTQSGLQGQNLVQVGFDDSTKDIFWGFPHPWTESKTLSDWNKMIVEEWHGRPGPPYIHLYPANGLKGN